MSAGSTETFGFRAVSALIALLAASSALFVSCNARPIDPPPPPSRHEIVPAPPGARGAHAAGTESEPGLPLPRREAGTGDLEWGDPSTPVPDPEAQPDAGADAGDAPEPEGVPL